MPPKGRLFPFRALGTLFDKKRRTRWRKAYETAIPGWRAAEAIRARQTARRDGAGRKKLSLVRRGAPRSHKQHELARHTLLAEDLFRHWPAFPRAYSFFSLFSPERPFLAGPFAAQKAPRRRGGGAFLWHSKHSHHARRPKTAARSALITCRAPQRTQSSVTDTLPPFSLFSSTSARAPLAEKPFSCGQGENPAALQKPTAIAAVPSRPFRRASRTTGISKKVAS